MYKSNVNEFLASLDDILPEAEEELAAKMVMVARFAHKSLLDKTSVHTGKTVRNWIATMDSAYSGVFDAIGSVNPGHTNKMPLGAEPRRSANEDAARASLVNIDLRTNPYREIYITNNAPVVYQMELGLAPLPSSDLEPRTWGMLELTYSEVVSKLSLGSL